MTKQKNIPQLRFPEFEGEWVERKIGNLGSIVGGGTPSKNITDYWDGTIPWISSSDLTDSNIYDINISRYISSNALKESATKIIPCNSILIVSRVGVGKIAVNDSEICTSQDFTNLIPKDGNYIFLAYLIKQKTKKLIEFNQGTSIKGFVKGDLEDLSINLPTLSEQQKIASFFMAIDSKLDLLRKKRDLLEKYKKGVMQKIFPSTGSGTSQEIRFRDENGNDYADWEEKKLGEVYTFISTNSFSRDNLNYEIGEIKNLHYGDIHTKFKSHFNVIKELVPYVNSEFASKIKTINFCCAGDLVIADASEDYADVGKTIEVINVNSEKIVSGLHTIHARPGKNMLSIGFGGHVMKSQYIRRQIMTIAQGTKVLSISANRLSEIEIQLPSLPEQEKIANFLSSIDTKIENLVLEIEGFEKWKKGLLGRMFC